MNQHSARAVSGVAFLVFCTAATGLTANGRADGADAVPLPAPSPTSSAVPEIGHVSTSDRQDEPLSATTRTTYVVSKAQLIEHGDLTVAGALERIPGVSVTQYGGLGSLASVSIRGSSSDAVLVLLDGRPIAGAQTAGVDLGALSTAGVQRIEIIEGGGATLYGTGAVGGVINVITGDGRGAGTPLVTLRAGSLGERSVTLESKHFVFERLVASNAFSYPAAAGDPAGSRPNSDLGSTTARAMTSLALASMQLTGSAGLAQRHLGIPGELDFGTALGARENTVDADARLAIAHTGAHSSATLELSAERQPLASYDYDGRDAASAGAPFADLSVESDVRAGLRNVVVGARDRLVYGVDLARGEARNGAADAFSATPYAQTAAYIQTSRRLDAATRFSAGLRAERDGALGGALTPSLGMRRELGRGFGVAANYSTAFRVPTQQDLYYPGFANPTLHPERSTGYDVTLTAARLLGGGSIGYFSSAGTDQIVLNPNANFAAPFGPANEPLVNARRTAVAGLTAQIATLPFHAIGASFGLTDTYRALDLTAAQRRLAYVPVIAANVELSYAAPGARARIAGAGILAHTVGNRFAPNGPASTYTSVDAYVRYRAFARAVVTLRALDLGNERYTEVAHYPVPGRTFRLELSTK